MPTPDFVLELRRHLGHAPLWMPGTTVVILRPAPGRTAIDWERPIAPEDVEVLCVRRSDNGAWTPVTGIVDPGEEPAVAAARELAEETDYVAATWNTLAEFYASPGFTTEGARIFLAQDLSLLPEERRTPREAEEAEFVPTWVRLDEVLDAVMDGRLHNPSTVLGVLATAQARARGWAELRPADAPWLRSPESL